MWHELILDAHTIYRLFIGIVIISAYLTLTKKQSLTQFTSIDFIGNFVRVEFFQLKMSNLHSMSQTAL